MSSMNHAIWRSAQNESCQIVQVAHGSCFAYLVLYKRGGVEMYNEKKKATNERYLSKFKTVSVRFPLEWVDSMQSAAAAAGQSLQGYILQAVRERMEREVR